MGTEVLTGSASGDLHILNAATLRPELVTPVTPGSPLISVIWHKELNQIVGLRRIAPYREEHRSAKGDRFAQRQLRLVKQRTYEVCLSSCTSVLYH